MFVVLQPLDHGPFRRLLSKVPPAPDLVRRDFNAEHADELYVADITYVPTWAGFLFLEVVLDACTRRVGAGPWPIT